jgi:hypothetical protein
MPPIGRVLIARGRDATDVAISNTSAEYAYQLQSVDRRDLAAIFD